MIFVGQRHLRRHLIACESAGTKAVSLFRLRRRRFSDVGADSGGGRPPAIQVFYVKCLPPPEVGMKHLDAERGWRWKMRTRRSIGRTARDFDKWDRNQKAATDLSRSQFVSGVPLAEESGLSYVSRILSWV